MAVGSRACRAGGERNGHGAAGAGRAAARRRRPAGDRPDDRAPHRRTPVGPARRPGAGDPAGRESAGGADPVAGRPGLSVVADRIHRELMDFTDKVRRNPDHELRRSATRFLFEFADDLQHDPDTIARADAIKEQLMARDEIANAAATAWTTLKRLVLEGVDDPSSTLRTRIADTVVRIGESLRDDVDLRDKVDNWLVRAAQHLVSQYGVEITAIITETIERWDAEEASRRIELHVGLDLQFIRINGTVVGSLAGLVIYAVAQLFF